MSLASEKKPIIAGVKFEDAEYWRQHDRVVDESLSYFEAKTQGKRLPKRADLNPADMKPILPEVAILELLYDRNGSVTDAKTSLLGSKLDDYYGALTGKLVSQYPAREVSERVLQGCKYSSAIKKPFMTMADTLSEQKNFLATTALYMPMSNDGTQVDRIFLHLQVKPKYFKRRTNSLRASL